MIHAMPLIEGIGKTFKMEKRRTRTRRRRGGRRRVNTTNNKMKAYKSPFVVSKNPQKKHSTDFMFLKSIEFIKERKDGEHPFALMVSIPDP